MEERQDTNMKKKVLLTFVGNRDPYASPQKRSFISRILGRTKEKEGDLRDREGSVLTVGRELKPDIVYLFPSSKVKAAETGTPDNQTEDRAIQASEIMEGWEAGPKCHVLPLMTDNVADTSKLYPCFRDNINKVMNELAKCANNRENWQGEYEITFAASSGTQQMNQTAQLFLANVPFEAHYCRCSDPKHVKKGGNRVFPVVPFPLEETTLLKRIDANVEGFYFHSVIEDCARLAEMSAFRPRSIMAGIVRNLFSAYESMDFMQYQEAYDLIRTDKENLDEFNDYPAHVPTERISAILDNQRASLDNLKGQGAGENACNLVDLYFNMERAFARGNYVDVLSRFWRLREGMMNFRLLANCCLNIRALSTPPEGKNKKKHEANLRVLKNSKYENRVNWEKDRIKTEDGLRSLSDILCGLFQDLELKQFEDKFHRKFENLRLVRNKTIVAHGMSPVERKDVEDCMTLGREIVALIPGGMEIYKSYPFTLENFREIVGLLKHV